MQSKLEQAREAIKAVFSDRSVSPEEIAARLKELRDEIMVFIESLDIDIVNDESVDL